MTLRQAAARGFAKCQGTLQPWYFTLLSTKEPKVKSLLTALALLALAVSSASAHLTTFTFHNKTWPGPKITGILFTRVVDGIKFGVPFVPPVEPKQSRTFQGLFEPPCMWWVTLQKQIGPDITAPTQMNVCTQRTIILGGDVGVPINTITFAR